MKVREVNKRIENSLKKRRMGASACQGMSRHIRMDIELLVAGAGMENIAVSDPKEEREK